MKSVPFMDSFLDITKRYAKLQSGEYLRDGPFPIIDQGQGAVAGYTDSEALVNDSGEVIIFGDHTRIVKFTNGPFALGADGVKVLQPNSGLFPKYAYRWLQSVAIPNLGYSRHFKFVKNLRVPVPSVEEQRRIADILDKADALRVKRREAIAHLDSLGQSIFHEMFGQESTSRPLSDAVTSLVGGRNVVGSENSSNPVRVLKISAVTSGIYRESESKPLPDAYQPDESHMVRAGDILISRANTTELVGASALVQETGGSVALPDKLWRAEPGPDILPSFLLATLQSDRVRSEISRRSTGSGGSMKNISKPKLLTIPIAMPSLERQKEFTLRMQTIRRLNDHHRQQLDRLDNLFLSLQDRAFKGEL